MNTLFTYRVNRIAVYCSLWSFLLNTIIFLICISAEFSLHLGPGILILLLYVVLGPIVLTILTVNALLNLKDIKQHVQAIFLVLLSFSVFVLYVKLLIEF